MTLQEYVEQTDLKRMPIGSVILEKEEYLQSKHGKQHVISVKIGNSYLGYRTNPELYHQKGKELLTLYTTDTHGNVQKPSVFAVKASDLD